MKHSNGRTIALSAAALFLAACSESGKRPEGKAEGAPAAGKAESPTGKATDAKADPKAPMMMTPEAGKIACFGVNACSGQSQCNVADGRVAAGSKGNACAGQNDCTGKGWISLSQQECDEKGGKPL
jgi:hypothetical protein